MKYLLLIAMLAACSNKNCDTTTVTAVSNCGSEGAMLTCNVTTADGQTRPVGRHQPLGGPMPSVGDTLCK